MINMVRSVLDTFLSQLWGILVQSGPPRVLFSMLLWAVVAVVTV